MKLKNVRNIKVGPARYELHQDADLFSGGSDDSVFMGQTHHVEARVIINPECNKNIKGEVLTHESLHMMIHQTGIPVDFDEEERLVQSLSPLLTMWIQDNPKLVRYIQESKT